MARAARPGFIGTLRARWALCGPPVLRQSARRWVRSQGWFLVCARAGSCRCCFLVALAPCAFVGPALSGTAACMRVAGGVCLGLSVLRLPAPLCLPWLRHRSTPRSRGWRRHCLAVRPIGFAKRQRYHGCKQPGVAHAAPMPFASSSPAGHCCPLPLRPQASEETQSSPSD